MKRIKSLNTRSMKQSMVKGRMRRVPDFLSVCQQDLLLRCQPEVRAAEEIRILQLGRDGRLPGPAFFVWSRL